MGLRAISLVVLIATLAACSVRKSAVSLMADALAGGGGVFATDDDPELVRDAIPFGLKTYESLLVELPTHRGLLLSLASGFVQYAYAFVQLDADLVDAQDAAAARRLRARARKLYLRGRDYGLRGLEAAHPGFGRELGTDRARALARCTKDDVPLLYWTGAGWAGALTAAKDDLDLVADLPTAAAFVLRARELDPGWGQGALEEVLISYEGSRSEAMGGSSVRAREHYDRAVALSGGRRASVHLALAESVAVGAQDVREFRRLIGLAKAVDPAADPAGRLANTLSLRRASWLEGRIPDLFLEDEVPQ
jgi:predicted anti-sigma-YlaC factor YlaD